MPILGSGLDVFQMRLSRILKMQKGFTSDIESASQSSLIRLPTENGAVVQNDSRDVVPRPSPTVKKKVTLKIIKI